MQDWNHEDVGPTALHLEKSRASERQPQRRYRLYTDLLDVMRQHQVRTTLIIDICCIVGFTKNQNLTESLKFQVTWCP